MNAGLNHAYRVVDHDTYAAVQADEWLRSVFAPLEQRTTRRPDWSYSGVYLYGRRTYLELFDEGPQGPAGHAGLALSLAPGDTSPLADAWTLALGAARIAMVDRPGALATDGGETPQPDAPWFRLAAAEPDRLDGLHLWSMEYHPDFLASWYPDLTPARSTSPADVLDRYAARASPVSRDACLLEDVTGIDLSLSRPALRFLRAHLGAVTMLDDRHDRLTATLDVTTIRAAAEERPRGLTAVTCSLQHAATPRLRTLGRSTLALDGRSARWSFAG